MLAVLGGLGAAVAWAVATLCQSRASRAIGVGSSLAWAMLVGLAVAAPAVAVAGAPDLGAAEVGWLAVTGVGNVLGLGLVYAGLRIGKVGVVAPIASTEGAIAAVISLVLGERIAPGVGVALAACAVGIVLCASVRSARAARAGRGVAFAAGAALSFGATLYAAGRVGETLPVAWVLLPARAVGAVAVAAPLALSGRLRLTGRTAPLVVAAGLCEVGGLAAYALGARHGIAVSSVLSSQYAALAALAALFLFRERLGRWQVAGVATIAAAVAALGVLQA